MWTVAERWLVLNTVSHYVTFSFHICVFIAYIIGVWLWNSRRSALVGRKVPLPQGNIPCTHLWYGLSWPQGHYHPMRNRTVLHRTALTHCIIAMFFTYRYLGFIFCVRTNWPFVAWLKYSAKAWGVESSWPLLTLYSLLVTWCTTSLTFNNCTVCPHYIYVFCIYLSTNRDFCFIQPKLIGFYNRDGKWTLCYPSRSVK